MVYHAYLMLAPARRRTAALPGIPGPLQGSVICSTVWVGGGISSKLSCTGYITAHNPNSSVALGTLYMDQPENKEKESLVITPVPALCLLLLNLEKQKGSPLTQTEVLEARDAAVCVALPASVAKAMEESRGYRDLNPEDIWKDWLGFKKWISESDI